MPHGHHTEHHLVSRSGWLRAALLGANDGIISTSSIVLGVAAAGGSPQSILVAGVASLVAGALSMAAGEYVSVSSQADTEAADLAKEKAELIRNPEGETRELAHIYVERGVEPGLARQVAEQLMAKDALPMPATRSASPRWSRQGRCRRRCRLLRPLRQARSYHCCLRW